MSIQLLPPVSSEIITSADLCVGRIVSWTFLRPIGIERQPPYAPIYRKSYGIIIHKHNEDLTIAILQEDGNHRTPETHEIFTLFRDMYVYANPDIRVIHKGDFVKEFRKSSSEFISRYRPAILEAFPIPKTYIVVNQRNRWANQPIHRHRPCSVICPNYYEMPLETFLHSSLLATYNIQEPLTQYMRTIQQVIRPSAYLPPITFSPNIPEPSNTHVQAKFRLLEIIESELEASRINEGEYLAMCNLLK